MIEEKDCTTEAQRAQRLEEEGGGGDNHERHEGHERGEEEGGPPLAPPQAEGEEEGEVNHKDRKEHKEEAGVATEEAGRRINEVLRDVDGWCMGPVECEACGGPGSLVESVAHGMGWLGVCAEGCGAPGGPVYRWKLAALHGWAKRQASAVRERALVLEREVDRLTREVEGLRQSELDWGRKWGRSEAERVLAVERGGRLWDMGVGLQGRIDGALGVGRGLALMWKRVTPGTPEGAKLKGWGYESVMEMMVALRRREVHHRGTEGTEKKGEGKA